MKTTIMKTYYYGLKQSVIMKYKRRKMSTGVMRSNVT